MKFFGKIRHSALVRYFVPAVVAGDAVTVQFVRSYRWTFFSTLVLLALYKFYSTGVIQAADLFFKYMAVVLGREYSGHTADENSLGGIIIFVASIYAVAFSLWGKETTKDYNKMRNNLLFILSTPLVIASLFLIINFIGRFIIEESYFMQIFTALCASALNAFFSTYIARIAYTWKSIIFYIWR